MFSVDASDSEEREAVAAPSGPSIYEYVLGSYGDTPTARASTPDAGDTVGGSPASGRSGRLRRERRKRRTPRPAVSLSAERAAGEQVGGSAESLLALGASYTPSPLGEGGASGGSESGEARGLPSHMLQPSRQSVASVTQWGSPVAPRESTVLGVGGGYSGRLAFQARFTVLDAFTVRCECVPLAPPGNYFEDRASLRFWRRKVLPPAEFSVRRRFDGLLQLRTAAFTLFYDPSASKGAFDHGGLRILLNLASTVQASSAVAVAAAIEQPARGAGGANVFAFGESDARQGNCGGTCRTLDGANGWQYDRNHRRDENGNARRYVDLGTGLLSRKGWAVVDDSGVPVFDASGWVRERDCDERSVDLYVFMYGDNYQQALQSFTAFSGRVPLVPRFALGNWWSRWWAYSQGELLEWMREWQERRRVPLAVCVIDMDWHLPGWTGYTWNRELFPEPDKMIAALHQLGVRVALNVHPAGGVHPHEAAYREMAEAMGIDPASDKPIHFNITSPSFVRHYLRLLHHPLEQQGVNLWWIDWQQGTYSGVAGLDPLFLLNHVHYLDHGRPRADGQRRALILSRYGGLGAHRYPIGFSGDTHATWESLAIQPLVTSTAGNVGFFYWSHDVGGFMGGVEPDGELFVRWVQLGLYSPILRLHCNKSPFMRRWPWGYEPTVQRAATAALRYRHRLVPYLYSESVKSSLRSVPLCRPMYWQWPRRNPVAYAGCGTQFSLGDSLLLAPFLEPAAPDVGLARRVMWLPPGHWRRLPSGEYLQGGRWMAVYGTLEEVPVFAEFGRIVPVASSAGCRSGIANSLAAMADDAHYDADAGLEHPAHLDVTVIAGGDGAFQLIEDDGSGGSDPLRCHCMTRMVVEFNSGQELTQEYARRRRDSLWVEVGCDFRAPASRELGGPLQWPEQRQYAIHLVGVRNVLGMHAGEYTLEVYRRVAEAPDEDIAARCTFAYDEAAETLSCVLPALPLASRFMVRVRAEELVSRRDRRAEKLTDLLQAMRLDNWCKTALHAEMAALLDGSRTPSQALAQTEWVSQFVDDGGGAGALTLRQTRSIYEIAYECGVEWLRRGYHPEWPQPPPVVAWNPRRCLHFVSPTPTPAGLRRERWLAERRMVRAKNEILADAIAREQLELARSMDTEPSLRPPPMSSAESDGYSDSLPPRAPPHPGKSATRSGGSKGAITRLLTAQESIAGGGGGGHDGGRAGWPLPAPHLPTSAPAETSTAIPPPSASPPPPSTTTLPHTSPPSHRTSSFTPLELVQAGYRVVRAQEFVVPADPQDDWCMEYRYGDEVCVRIAHDTDAVQLLRGPSAVAREERAQNG